MRRGKLVNKGALTERSNMRVIAQFMAPDASDLLFSSSVHAPIGAAALSRPAARGRF